MDFLAFEELIEFLLGSPAIEKAGTLEEAFEQQYGLDMEKAYEFTKVLVPFCMVSRSPITGEVYQGFATREFWLMKALVVQARPGA